MWQRLKCLLTGHDWRGAEVWMTGGRRQCFACGRKERLHLVDVGRNRVWIKDH